MADLYIDMSNLIKGLLLSSCEKLDDLAGGCEAESISPSEAAIQIGLVIQVLELAKGLTESEKKYGKTLDLMKRIKEVCAEKNLKIYDVSILEIREGPVQ